MSTVSMLIIPALSVLGIVALVYADQFTFSFPANVTSYSHFWSYNKAYSNKDFISYMEPNIVNMMTNVSTTIKDCFDEVLSASQYETSSPSSEMNAKAAKTINAMWARDFINDLNLYRMHYIHQRYLSAAQQLMKETVLNPTFEDIPFDEPLDRMVVYMWAYHLEQGYQTFMSNASKLHYKWQAITEEINTNQPEETQPE